MNHDQTNPLREGHCLNRSLINYLRYHTPRYKNMDYKPFLRNTGNDIASNVLQLRDGTITGSNVPKVEYRAACFGRGAERVTAGMGHCAMKLFVYYAVW